MQTLIHHFQNRNDAAFDIAFPLMVRDESTLLGLNRIMAANLYERINYEHEGVHIIVMQNQEMLLSGTEISQVL